MKTCPPNRFRGQSALTLVEMMVATTLLVVMMLGLTAMFNQTQRAFRSGLKQVDVFEGGRAVADLMARDFESLGDTASRGKVNFFYGDFSFAGYSELVQPNGTTFRTNRFQYIFGQSQVGSDWIGTGYCFKTNAATGVMTLYRFTKQTNTPNNLLETDFRKASQELLRGSSETNVHRVAEGIISLRVRAFNKNGVEIAPGTNFLSFPITNYVNTVYETNRIPSSVEIELGILEPQTLEQAKTVANPLVFLERQAGKVHVFRQQIPIRNAPR
ncbi:MAG: hypothetical protein ABIV39_00955 [Verrucomicrobiota bacterium]